MIEFYFKGVCMYLIKSRSITDLHARQILDSRGIPTVSVDVVLSDSSVGTAEVPSGASTGKYEACELRDNANEYNGKSVYHTIDTILNDIKPIILERSINDLYQLDTLLCHLDGTMNKSRLGANAILAISLAYTKAQATSYGQPLFRYLGGIHGHLMPVPMMNIINGGAHANNNLDIQEFMIMPHGAKSFSEAIRMGCETYQALKQLHKERSFPTAVGDEGGFAPNLSSHEEALMMIVDAIEKAGYIAGQDISIALDIAASEWKKDGMYHMPKQNRKYSAQELSQYYETLCTSYPIYSIEDPFGEEDFESFTRFTQKHSELQIVGDDLFVTNPKRIKRGIELASANAVLIKPNQIGTLSETLQAIELAQEGSFNTVISHRSGDTPDTSIADIAVAVNAGQIKTGAPCRGERIAKYNRLLEIEEMLGSFAQFATFR